MPQFNFKETLLYSLWAFVGWTVQKSPLDLYPDGLWEYDIIFCVCMSYVNSKEEIKQSIRLYLQDPLYDQTISS